MLLQLLQHPRVPEPSADHRNAFSIAFVNLKDNSTSSCHWCNLPTEFVSSLSINLRITKECIAQHVKLVTILALQKEDPFL